MNLPLAIEDFSALKQEIRQLAEERNVLILAHNQQAPEIQDVADCVGDGGETYSVKVEHDVAARARVPIERMLEPSA